MDRLTASSMRYYGVLGLGLLLAVAGPVEAGEGVESDLVGDGGYRDSLSFGNLGGVGLLETRTARFLPDGEIAVGASYADPLASYFVTWQATPWLEATARYSEARGEADDLDRALDLKIRLIKELDFFPAVAVGFQDMLGSGPYSGEYFVFTKQTGSFDVTFGVAWGYPAARGGINNPFEIFSGSFKNRTDNIDRNGVPAFKNFFSGERMGLFGGIEYRTSLRGLTVKLEYNDGDARTLALADPIENDFPVNAGVNYRPLPWLNLAAGFARGDTLSLGLTLRTNLHDFGGVAKTKDPRPLQPAGRLAAPEPEDRPVAATEAKIPVVLVPVEAGTRETGQLTVAVTRALFDAGLGGALVELGDGEATVTLSLPPAEAGSRNLKAAYVILSNLPIRYRAVRIRNRVGDEVGREGQLFTRQRVETFARVDAAFDDLLAAGGVSEVTSADGTLMVALSPRRDGAVGESSVAAAADLLPDARVVEVRTPAGETQRHATATLRTVREREHLLRYLDSLGFQLAGLTGASGVYEIAVHAEGRFDEGDIARAIDGARAILMSGDQPVDRVTLTVTRGGIEVARAERPQPRDVLEARSEPEDAGEAADPEGMRYLPLFGFVRWDEGGGALGERPTRRRRTVAATRSLTQAEADKLKSALERQGLRPLGWRIAGDGAEVAIANDRFRSPAVAVGRGARALTAVVPGDVDWLGVTTLSGTAPLSGVTVLRRDMDKALDYAGSPEEIWLNTEILPGEAPRTQQWTRFSGAYPHLSWAVYPELKQHFGNGADGGYKAEGFVTLAGDMEVLPGLTFSAAFTRDIAGNLDNVPPGPGVTTPRVRSDIARYVDEGENAISRAIVDYVLRPVDDIYVRASAGLYESMFGGAGIEALYRPQHADYAIGVDVGWVKQRDFDQLLDFRDYTVWTGHLSLYREWPRLGLETVVRLGRYLAGDVGGTFDVYRRFENGMRLGAWISVTDMARSEFGRDSFAKGLYLSIPIDLFLPWSLRRDVMVEGRALNRDGGQRLDRGPDLYELTRPGTERGLRQSWPDLLD